MLLESEHRPVSTGGMLASARATIRSSAKMFRIFSDQTYSQIKEAIVRELTANAIDAQTQTNPPVTTPVEVWLPTDIDPTLRFRDRGCGMSHDFMMTRFTCLGDGSTKDTDNGQIGGFGAGRFSAFGYCDQFSIRTVHDGVLGIYTMFKDEEDIPCVGLLGQTETDEPNGTEISFPVKSEDFQAFAAAAQNVLVHFDPMPTVYNGTITPPPYLSRGRGWAVRPQSGPLAIIMGGVRYPVRDHQLNYATLMQAPTKDLLQYGLDLWLPIGSCEVALSREELAYTPKTKDRVHQALIDVLNEVTSSFSTMFDHFPTEWDAVKALWKEAPANESGYHYGRAKLVLDHAQYRGSPLHATFSLLKGSSARIDARGRRHSRDTKCPSPTWHFGSSEYRLDSYEAIIIDDLEPLPKNRNIARIKKFVEDTCRRDRPILILRNPQFSTDVPLDDPMFVKTSDMEVPLTVRQKYNRPAVRMFQNPRFFDFNPRSHAQIHEIDPAFQPETGILIVGETFEVKPDDKAILTTELVKYNECIFVNQNDGKKLLNAKGSTWRLAADVFKERLQRVLRDDPDLPYKLFCASNPDAAAVFHPLRKLSLEDIPERKRNSPLAKLVSLRDRYVKTLTDQQLLLLHHVEHTPPPRVNFKALTDSLKQKQPLAWHLLCRMDGLRPNTLDFRILENLL